MSYIVQVLKLAILTRAVKQLARISPDDARVLMGKLEAYAQDRGAAFDVKPLKGHRGVFRLRHGGWRAIFEINVKCRTMTVVDVLNRRDAYK